MGGKPCGWGLESCLSDRLSRTDMFFSSGERVMLGYYALRKCSVALGIESVLGSKVPNMIIIVRSICPCQLNCSTVAFRSDISTCLHYMCVGQHYNVQLNFVSISSIARRKTRQMCVPHGVQARLCEGRRVGRLGVCGTVCWAWVTVCWGVGSVE